MRMIGAALAALLSLAACAAPAPAPEWPSYFLRCQTDDGEMFCLARPVPVKKP